MYNITLISTRHDNIGECNSLALCHILESIRPDVIFEEIPPSFFGKYYVEKTRTNLEVEAINAFLKTHNVQHIPVDIDEIPPEAFFRDHKRAIEKLLGLTDIHGFNYRSLVDASKRHAANYGFNYLNSRYYIRHIEELHDATEAGLQKLNDDALSQAYRSWCELNDRRENEMLQNIYNFSKEHSYNTAVFLLGAGHRKSISNKLQHYDRNESLRLNWLIYGVE